MKRISAIGMTLLLLLYSFACQPTPDKPIVINKNDGRIEEILNMSPVPVESTPSGDTQAPKSTEVQFYVADT